VRPSFDRARRCCLSTGRDDHCDRASASAELTVDHLYSSWQIVTFSEPYAQSQGQSAAGALESVLNAGYVIQITKEFSVQPDVQYIIRPGGFGQSGNALVLGLQIAVEL